MGVVHLNYEDWGAGNQQLHRVTNVSDDITLPAQLERGGSRNPCGAAPLGRVTSGTAPGVLPQALADGQGCSTRDFQRAGPDRDRPNCGAGGLARLYRT